jgi:phosphonatase-like hydrolase
MPRVRLVIFDIGGTLIEDNGEVTASFSSALAAHGLPVTEVELRELKGSSKLDVIRTFVERRWGAGHPGNHERVRASYDGFRAELEGKFVNGGVKPIAGADATLTWLRTHQIVCATTTGFYREAADIVLEIAGWRHTFAANICSDDVKEGRPAPYMIFHAMEAAGVGDVRSVLNVGDTPLDLQAGSRAGALGTIGVLTGIHESERLRRESPSHLIHSVADLPALIETHYS